MKPKVAIIQEWLVTVGGSDKVVKAIHDIFPEADIYTLVCRYETLKELGLENVKIYESFISKLPGAKKNHRRYLPLFPIAIEQFDLSKYDIIISSSHSVAKGVLTTSAQLHICYCHSPMRYAWDLYHSYLDEAGLRKGFKGILAKYFLHRIRIWDFVSSARVDYFIANSDYISARIKKVYRRESTTIYPNIDIDKFTLNESKEDFYVACSRLVSYKKIDLIVSAFTKWEKKKKLVVIGDGPDRKRIQSIAGENIEFLGFQPLSTLVSYLGKAKCMIFAADEDFGMLPVEAQACGTPVLGLRKGGTLETIIEGSSGYFFDEQSEEAIISALEKFEKSELKMTPKEIRENSKKFSEKNFKARIKDFIEEKYENL